MHRLTFTTTVCDGVDLQAPVIYLWEVALPDGGLFRYVGKASEGAKRPARHYARKCERYFKGLPYKADNPFYREPHWQLGDAWVSGWAITLTFLCNATRETIDELEARWQDVYGLPRRTPDGRRRMSPYAGSPLPPRTAPAGSSTAAKKSV